MPEVNPVPELRQCYAFVKGVGLQIQCGRHRHRLARRNKVSLGARTSDPSAQICRHELMLPSIYFFKSFSSASMPAWATVSS